MTIYKIINSLSQSELLASLSKYVMQVQAELKNLRVSPRKVRLVAGTLRGLDVAHAKYQLDAVVKKSSRPLSKLLASAVANAINNFSLEESNLFIKDVNVDEGPKLKRFRPKGFGRTSPIEKKTSHIRIILEEKIAGLKAKSKPRRQTAEVSTPTAEKVSTGALSETIEESKPKAKFETRKPEIKREINKKGVISNIGDRTKKLFRRKAV